MAKMHSANLEFVREDDYVEYFIFPRLPDNFQQHQNRSPATPDIDEELRLHLTAVQKQCESIVEKHVRELGYIWHKDEFHLQPRTGSAQERLLNDETKVEEEVPRLPHLHGVSHYGDNIADEWFIVYLLSQLTRELPDCIVRVVDSDGEFLLIEAADVLPKWANPETCEQRVYIVDGKMQLVQNSPSNTAKLMPVDDAVAKIRQNPTLYRVSKEIQACINERFKEFVSAEASIAAGHLHHQIVRLPLGVAALLKERPALIAPAVRAFCERDPVDMKACRTMRYFPPEQRVRTNVCFTRCLYAMIMHSNYVPDRKIGWNLSGATTSEPYKEDLLGVKIACGFEILSSQVKDANGGEENEPAWRAYVRSLAAKGYFRGQLEGSEEYKRLLEEARIFYKRNNERFRTAPLVGRDILELLRSLEINADSLRDQENNLQSSDSDDWLNITADQLDAMLQERYGPKKLYKSNGDINAEEFTKNIAEFLEKQSAFDGIDNDSDDDIDDEEDEHDDDNKKDSPTANASSKNPSKRHEEFKAKLKKNASLRRACKQNSVIDNSSSSSGGHKPNTTKTRSACDGDDDEGSSIHVRNFLDFVIPEDNWDSNSEMSDYEDEDDMERNFAAMASAEMHIDADIKAYMAQMDKELAKTTIGQSFVAGTKKASTATAEDDFDDIESFEPININVNTLKNMMDSYKSQIGGAGPASNLFSAMGVGMSTADESAADTKKKLSESTV